MSDSYDTLYIYIVQYSCIYRTNGALNSESLLVEKREASASGSSR